MFSVLLHNVSNYRLSYIVTTPQKKCVLCTYITTPPISHSQPTPILNMSYLHTIYSSYYAPKKCEVICTILCLAAFLHWFFSIQQHPFLQNFC